jgi:hypothetical protein
MQQTKGNATLEAAFEKDQRKTPILMEQRPQD